MNNSNGYKMTEVGLIPKDWAVSNVGTLFEFSKKPRSLSIPENELIPFIPMELIRDDNKLIQGWINKKSSEISSGTFVFKNDLIIAKITPSFENGKQAILYNLPKDYGYATTEVWALHSKNNNANSEYLFNYIKIPEVRIRLASKMDGATGRQRLPRNVVESLKYPLPPLPEQQKIVSVLSTIQEAKEKTENVIRATKELKKSMMKHLFTYGPVPAEDAEKVPLKETEIGMIPEHWEINKLGEIVIHNKGLQRGPWGGSIKKDIFVPSGYKIYEQGNVIKNNFSLGSYFINENKFKEMIDFEVKAGDILISAAGTLGKLAIVPDNIKQGIINQALLRIRIDESKILKFFFKYFFNSIVDKGAMEGYSHGATLKNLSSIKVLRNIFIPIPPLPEQKQIADILSALDSKIEAEENKKQALEALFKTLLSLLMTGKLRVKDLEIPV